ncbi:MAG: YbaB/EbfC family nucleoid-associated protein [Cardiobacteriaceae bacterium]|nr:YbaB/EbfC family nucleoid-associated protein [Cardiobacteriaceae bacterium]
MLPGKLGSMMKKAQEMQENMQKMQAELANKHIIGISGAGAVKITLNGQSVQLSEEALKEDKEMLEALLAAAFSDASAKVSEMTQEEMAKVTGGINLPGGLKLPF